MSASRAVSVVILSSALVAACGESHGRDDAGPMRDAAAPDGGPRDGGLRDAGPPSDCTALTEAECIGSPDCGPIYDDFCCPLCLPIGACADCMEPRMYRCGSIAEACASDPPVCGLPIAERWTCRGGVADCSMAFPVANGRCDVPGCVQAIEAGCADDCPVECVPVRPESCTALCFLDPPPCPMGMVNEGDGMCFTGRCIPATACEPAPMIGVGP